MKNIIRRSLELILVISLALSLLGPAAAQAAPLPPATCVWTGLSLSNSLWSTPSNWTGCTGLSNDMTVTLAFPSGAARKSNTNDLDRLNVVDLGIQAGGYSIGGNAISLSHGIGMDGAGSAVNLPIQLTANVDIIIAAGATLHLNDVVSESTTGLAINKTKRPTYADDGTLDLNSANTFTGGISVSAGQVTLSQAQAGGSGMLTVLGGATLAIGDSVTTLANPLTLTGTGTTGLGALHYESSPLTLTGPVSLNGAATIQSSVGMLTLANAISGTGDLTLDGGFTLEGSSANTFTGKLILPRGMLFLNHSAGVTAVPGDLVVGPGDGINPIGVAAYAANQFSSTSRVFLEKYAELYLHGNSQTVAGIVAWDRPCQIVLGGDQTFTLTFNTVVGPQNYVNCDVTGTGKLLVKGNGMQSFEHNDPLLPFNGTLEVQGSAASYLGAFQSNGVYYLHGSGTGGGFLNDFPGSKVGSLVAENAYLSIQMADPASASQAGSVLLSGTGTDAVFQFMALNASGLKVPGAVELGSAQLYVCYFIDQSDNPYVPDLADTPSNPKRRTLIQKDAAGPVTGTFNGLPEGSQISLPYCYGGETTYPLRLTYQGGDGNDVVVTRLVQDSLTLVAVPSSPGINQTTQLVATLVPLENAYGAAPSQKAAFYDGSTLLGEASFVGSTATLTAGPFLGPHFIQARLVGDPSFVDATSNTVSFRVGRSLFVPVVRK